MKEDSKIEKMELTKKNKNKRSLSQKPQNPRGSLVPQVLSLLWVAAVHTMGVAKKA